MNVMNTDRFEEKDVINTRDGRRIGCVTDLEFDPCDGRITGIVVSGDAGFLGFGKREETVIPWCRIQKIGEDVILVDAEGCPVFPSSKKKCRKSQNC